MTGPQDPTAPSADDGFSSGPASDPGQGGYGAAGGYAAPGGAPSGYPAPPGAQHGMGLGAPAAYGVPQGYPPPSAYGGAPPSPFGQPGGPQLASWGSRVGATLLDSFIVLAFIVVAVVLGAVLSSVSEALGGVVMALGYLAGLAFFFWQLWVQGQTGQTIGKKQVGIRLLGEHDGRPVGGGLSIARAFVHVVDQIPCYVGYLWPLWDDKNQTFTDKLLKTVVVRA